MLIPILENFPTDISLKQLFHYGQLINSRKFSQYDFTQSKNLEIYGTNKPPLYNLSNVKTKLEIIYATNDLIVRTQVNYILIL